MTMKPEEPEVPPTLHTQPEETGGEASAALGVVMLDGPDGVAVTMTADAASETAVNLSAAADEARTQVPDPASDD